MYLLMMLQFGRDFGGRLISDSHDVVWGDSSESSGSRMVPLMCLCLTLHLGRLKSLGWLVPLSASVQSA